MIPFVFTVALSFVSFLASAFVILRIVIPILPPHPLSRRVAPSEFGLPNYNFRSLSSADKSHLWLASLDLLALCIFIWQAVSEYSGGTTGLADAWNAAASARLWLSLTIRQTCLLVISVLTFVHIRMGYSVSFGRKHWMIWAPTLILTLTSTALAVVFASIGIPTFFAGIVAYSVTTAVFSTAAFCGLVYTLVVIKRNLAALNEPTDSWPPAKEVQEKPRQSFATEDIDVLREGSSWVTSDAGSSRHETMSNWSFSTHHTCQGSIHSGLAVPQQPAVQSKSSCSFTLPTSCTDLPIPPVPPLPSAYRANASPTCVISEDPDPFRRDAPRRPRTGSHSSWLTSPSVSQVTMSNWSYSTDQVNTGADVNAVLYSLALPSHPTAQLSSSVLDVNAALLSHVSRPVTPMASVAELNAGLPPQATFSRPATPALSTAKVLGGYGHSSDSEKGIASLAVTGSEIEISYSRYVFWLLSIWVPLCLSLPYLVGVLSSSPSPSGALPVMLVLSVTLSSPLLVINILVRSPIPIPTGLFGVPREPPSIVMRGPSPTETLSSYCQEYKKSNVTVIEGRPSGDVWLSQGDAVDGRGKLGRALGLIGPLPRLAVLPFEEQEEGEITPPLPMQEDTTILPTPQSQSTYSVELGRLRKESKASSHFSGHEDFATRIMIAQRHYSAVATTVVLPTPTERVESPDGLLGVATGVDVAPCVTPTLSSHLRSRSVSSILHPVTNPDISAPPSEPLPPTPPNIRTAKHLIHRKSRSSEFSFGAAVNDDIREIDALTAGVLPLLVPGLKLGEEMKIQDWDEFDPPLSSTIARKKQTWITKKLSGSEFGVLGREDSIQFHSTPVQGTHGRKREARRGSGHSKKNLSLPSLDVDKDVACAWKNATDGGLDNKIEQDRVSLTSDADRRKTDSDGGATPSAFSFTPETAKISGGLLSARNTNLRVEIPLGTNSARTSVTTLIPPSAASTVTLFEAESIFEPVAQSTPSAVGKNSEIKNTTRTSISRRSSIVYVKSEGKSTRSANGSDVSALDLPKTKPSARKSQRKLYSPESENRSSVASSGGLRPLTLLKNRDTNKEGDASKHAGTRPLILAKKQKSKVTHDENVNPNNSGGKNLPKPLRLERSQSSKMRGMLRRDEVLPTVVVRPPSASTNANGSHEYQ